MLTTFITQEVFISFPVPFFPRKLTARGEGGGGGPFGFVASLIWLGGSFLLAKIIERVIQGTYVTVPWCLLEHSRNAEKGIAGRDVSRRSGLVHYFSSSNGRPRWLFDLSEIQLPA